MTVVLREDFGASDPFVPALDSRARRRSVEPLMAGASELETAERKRGESKAIKNAKSSVAYLQICHLEYQCLLGCKR